jgi:hypothetical protein
LCTTVGRGCKGDLELPIIVGAVRHHGGVGGCFWGSGGGIARSVDGTQPHQKLVASEAGRERAIGNRRQGDRMGYLGSYYSHPARIDQGLGTFVSLHGSSEGGF